MHTIGMLGGMSWESTLLYYQKLNRGIQAALGGLHSAKICLYSLDFDEIKELQYKGNWEELTAILIKAAQRVEICGADFLIICTNTMHKVAQAIQESIGIPLLHIADCTAEALILGKIKRVGLLGTNFTMEEEFYKGRLSNQFGFEVIVPSSEDRQIVHNIIYQELCLGKVKSSSKYKFLHIIDKMKAMGASAVILGCTEIAMLIESRDTDIPLYDTTSIHADKAVQWAIAKKLGI